MDKEIKTHSVYDTFEQGQETSCELEETTSISKADKAKKCLDGKQKANLVKRNKFNSFRKGQPNILPKRIDLSSDKSKSPPNVVNDTLFDIWQTYWLVWRFINNINLQLLIPLWCRLRKKFFVFDIGKNRRSNVLQLILLTFCLCGTSYALPSATIMTSPTVFGEDVTFQCLYKDHRSLSALSTVWLKGQEKESIIYGTSSTKGGKYTSIINHDADIYLYLLTIHNVSLSDLDIYSCEFNFQRASLSFTMDGNLSFIFLPDTSDVVFNISESEMNIWIPKIYPVPNCTAVYNGEDVSKLMNKNDQRETVMYSTLIHINLSECSGNLNLSCILDARTFTWSKNVQQCCKGTECPTEIALKIEYQVAIVAVVVLILLVMLAVILYYFKYHKEDRIRLYNSPDAENSG